MFKKFGERLYQYALLMRLHRPIGITLLLWPTLWALWIAGDGKPNPALVVIFVLGVVLTRSAGCVMNDIADQKFDGQVRRTRNRPLVTGKVSRKEALILFIVLCGCAGLLLLWLDWRTIGLASIALLIMIIYPFMKRITHMPQLVLGVAFAWGIPMAFMAQAQALPGNAWLLFSGTLLWIVAYDTLYAMADREDDLRAGIKSTAILFGKADRCMVGLLHAGALGILAYLGSRLNLAATYYWGLLAAALVGAYQLYMIRQREPQLCFQAFLRNNELGAFIFLGIVLNYSWH